MNIWTVGTSSAVPSRNRGLPANIISYKGERILFDCGEGTQRKLMAEKLGLNENIQDFHLSLACRSLLRLTWINSDDGDGRS